MKKTVLAVIFFIISFLSFAQTNGSRLDSLLNVSKGQKEIQLIQTFNEISWEFRNSQPDSALHYAKASLHQSEILNNRYAIASSYNNIASSYEVLDKIDSAKIYHQKSLKIKLQINDSLGMADTYTNLGIIEDKKSNNHLALQYYFKALNIYENHAVNFEKVPTVLVNIGIVYKKEKEYEKALKYYEKALEIYKTNNFKIGIAIVTGNIGALLIKLRAYKESIEYSEKARQLYDEMGYIMYVPYTQIEIAVAKDSLKQYLLARSDYFRAIEGFENDNNLYELSNAKMSLANNYTKKGEFNSAKKELNEALSIINNKNLKEFKVRALKQMAQIDEGLGNYKSAFLNYKKYSVLQDSLNDKQRIKTIYELETKYQTEKKEKQILSQRAEIAEKELNINQKNTQIIGLVLLAVVISILAYLLYNQQKLKNAQLKKEGELKEALVKIETQNKLQEQRLRISRDLHDNIGAQLTFIISSIENLQYGFKLKNEKLTTKLTGISDFARDTIYELRDTIWAMNKNSISVDDLQVRIANFIDKANLAAKSTAFSFNVDEGILKEDLFSSVVGMNIYRIIQESTNNAIKYAESTSINVSFKKLKNKILVTIEDNGKGFDENQIELGSGLTNMRKRAGDMNAHIKIESTLNMGTKIILEV